MSKQSRTSDRPLILVTGSTGKTGTSVVEQLLEQGFPVRALIRRHDERSQRLSDLGADVVVGDFLDLASMRAALNGVQRVYFCYPPADQLVEATSILAVAARDAGVEAVVNMSQISAREQARSALSRQHWLSEQILDWASIGAAHIRPSFFTEDLYLFTGPSIAAQGAMVLPFGAGRHAPVSATDIARVVTAILVDPLPHVGRRHILTGDQSLAMPQMAEVLSVELGKPIAYVDLPPEQWRSALVQLPEFSPFLADHLTAVARDHQDGIFDAATNVVEQVGGRPPQSLASFVQAHRSAFVGEPEAAGLVGQR